MADAGEETRDRLRVDAEAEGQRLDRWLAQRFPGESRARMKTLIEGGSVRLVGKLARPAARLKSGHLVEVDWPPPAPAGPEAQPLPLEIVYQDSFLAVVEKPAGLVVHPGAGSPSPTLVNALLYHLPHLSGVGGVLRPGIVHRLDKGTSGLLVVAKNDLAHRELSRQFAARTVEKEYLALALGVPRPRLGTIDAPIGRHPVDRVRMAVRRSGGRTARSSYEVLEEWGVASLLRVRIHTGRTHQIRVHLASLGHPLAGDKVYGGTKLPSSVGERWALALGSLRRPALHAARIAFDHPGTKERLAFVSRLPADLAAVVERLRTGVS